jgi:segregation and condensation protein B
MREKEIIEAALFAAGEAVDAQSLAKIVGKPKKKVMPMVHDLINEYLDRSGGIEIVDLGDRYVMQVKPEYTDIVRHVAPKELGSPILRTLSMIAYHQPVVQAELVDMRGNSAYDHIRELKNRGFVEAVPHGRTKLLRTTVMFADYFGLESNDPESIRKKMIELSRQQSGQNGLDRWLGRRFVGVTPMYEPLMDMCGIRDYRVIDAYNPTEDEIDSLSDIYKMVISRGYREKVERYYDGEIIEVGSTTFDDLIDAIDALESVWDENTSKGTIERLEQLKEGYVSKALVISRKVTPATDMIARIVNDLRIGVSSDGIVIAPDYGTSSEGVEIAEDADILVPTHGSLEGDLIDRVCKKYEAIIEGLKSFED